MEELIMYRVAIEIDQYEFKVKDILNKLNNSSGNKGVDELALETGLTKDEITAIVHYLTRPQYIERKGQERISISRYGKMINSGEINVGYAPL